MILSRHHRLCLWSCLWAGIILLALNSMALAAWAIPVQDVINPRLSDGGWVTDMANILSPATEQQLNQMIAQFEAEQGAEIAVVTVPDTAPSATPKAFATELFNTWGIGKAEENNGILFLVSMADRRVEIEVGLGLPQVLPNEHVSTIIETTITPQFKRENFDAGVLAGTRALITTLENPGQNMIVPWWWRLTTTMPWHHKGILILVFGGTLWGFLKAGRQALQPPLVPPEQYERIYSHSTPWHRNRKRWEIPVLWTSVAIATLLFLWLLMIFQLDSPQPLPWPILMIMSLMMGLIPGGFLGTLIIIPLVMRLKRWFQTLYCSQCNQAMVKLPWTSLTHLLNRQKQVAWRLRSMRFEAWHCPRCYPQAVADATQTGNRTFTGLHFMAIVLQRSNSKFQECQVCDELTMVETHRVLQKATRRQEGLCRINQRCHCCDFHEVKDIPIPLLPKRTRSSSWSAVNSGSGSNNNSYGSYSGYSGGSSGGGSYGGSDSGGGFGGGSSGGDGAGGDW